MAICQISLPIPNSKHNLSSCRILSGENNPISVLPLRTFPSRTLLSPIQMGGGPRTFPGGVSKWQWKRMQAKKAKQLLKARLARERQVYEMRKRAELKAAVAELERPWEMVEDRAPKLFSVSADEQLKVLADRFQRPGGFDMWSKRDGPQLFSPVDGLPSARFFPKGVVHSTKPYGKIGESLNGAEKLSLPVSFSEAEDDVKTNGYTSSGGFVDNVSDEDQNKADRWIEKTVNGNEKSDSDGKFRNKPYNKITGNSNVAEKLSLRSSVSDNKDDVERDGYKNLDKARNIERQMKANKWIKNSENMNVKIGGDGKFGNKPYQKTGKYSNVAECLSSSCSFSEVQDDIRRNGYANLDGSRDNLMSEGQIKASKWMKNPMDRNEKFGSNGKFRNKPFRKYGGKANGAKNMSSPRSFSELEDCVERNGYKKSDGFGGRFNGEGHIKANQSTQKCTNWNVKNYNNGKYRDNGSTRRLQVEKSNTFNESRGSSSEVFDMDLLDDGSYGFESENWQRLEC